jgi:hypothetical protein
MSKIEMNCETIKIPDNDTDRRLFIKKGFTRVKIRGQEMFKIPDNYECFYEKVVKIGKGCSGCDYVCETWKITELKTKKQIVSLVVVETGDYYAGDIIKWF